MKRNILRVLAGLTAICILVLSVGAVDVSRENKHIEIVINGDIDKEKEQLIIDTLSGKEIITTRLNPLCLISHNITESRVYVTSHRVYSTAPRCQRITYKTFHCTRSGCNYLSYSQLGAPARLYCCS